MIAVGPFLLGKDSSWVTLKNHHLQISTLSFMGRNLLSRWMAGLETEKVERPPSTQSFSAVEIVARHATEIACNVTLHEFPRKHTKQRSEKPATLFATYQLSWDFTVEIFGAMCRKRDGHCHWIGLSEPSIWKHAYSSTWEFAFSLPLRMQRGAACITALLSSCLLPYGVHSIPIRKSQTLLAIVRPSQWVPTNTHTYIYTYTNIHKYTQIYTHIHNYAQIHTNACIPYHTITITITTTITITITIPYHTYIHKVTWRAVTWPDQTWPDQTYRHACMHACMHKKW